jgi:hypothetical protein
MPGWLHPVVDAQNLFVVAAIHVPSRVIDDPTYRETSEKSPYGWMSWEDGSMAPFGANGSTLVPHPDGDGHLILLCCI